MGGVQQQVYCNLVRVPLFAEPELTMSFELQETRAMKEKLFHPRQIYDRLHSAEPFVTRLGCACAHAHVCSCARCLEPFLTHTHVGVGVSFMCLHLRGNMLSRLTAAYHPDLFARRVDGFRNIPRTDGRSTTGHGR